MKKKCAVLIPALDPPENFLDYTKELIDAGFDAILVVDDGSQNKEIFRDLEKLSQVTVLTHEKNFGKGKALRTGLSYYQSHFSSEEYAGVITADSDGQHLAEDVKKLAGRLIAGTDRMILGVRDFDQADVPPKSRYGNKLTSLTFRILMGLSISDTQTGLRGIPDSLVSTSLSIPGDRFEYETAVLMAVGKKTGFEEIPIHTVYHDGNEGTHFHPVKDSFRIYRLFAATFFRYLAASLSSFVLDILLFGLGTKLLLVGHPLRIPISTAGARIFSGIFNYLMNRNVVFKSNRSYARSGVSYLLLCIIQCLASAGLVSGICHVLTLDEVPVKIVVDTCLFVINYHIQKRIIFQSDPEEM